MGQRRRRPCRSARRPGGRFVSVVGIRIERLLNFAVSSEQNGDVDLVFPTLSGLDPVVELFQVACKDRKNGVAVMFSFAPATYSDRVFFEDVDYVD